MTASWSLHDAAKNIYRAQVSTDLFRQLYIDGSPAIRARTPNRESGGSHGPYWPCRSTSRPTTLISQDHWQACADTPMAKHWQPIGKGGKKSQFLAKIGIAESVADHHCHELSTLMDSLEPAWTNRKVAQKWHSSRKKHPLKRLIGLVSH